jgi:hypothetical protein
LGLARYTAVVAMTGLWLLATWVFALGYLNAAIERYLLVPLLVAAVWVCLAVDVGIDLVARLVPRVRPAEDRRATSAVADVIAVVLLVTVLAAVPTRLPLVDASGDDFGRRWLDATLGAVEPNAVVVSWWSFSTPLWYGRWVEGRRPDVTIIDDRDVLDDGLGSAEAVVDRYLDERPVYIVRIAEDLPSFRERFVLEPVAGIPAPGDVYRVVSRQGGTAGGPM